MLPTKCIFTSNNRNEGYNLVCEVHALEGELVTESQGRVDERCGTAGERHGDTYRFEYCYLIKLVMCLCEKAT